MSKVIIAGSRNIFPFPEYIKSIADFYPNLITEVVSGNAIGVDKAGEHFAKCYKIPVKDFPAMWKVDDKFDRFAGFKRNIEMAKYADGLIAIWDMNSRGTKHMIKQALKYKLKIIVLNWVDGTVFRKFEYGENLEKYWMGD